jgi:tripartite-type tricarboxylate transporter receptor subunit TctC
MMRNYRQVRGLLCGALATVLIAGVAALHAPAQAQSFPSKPITLVVNWPAGGGMDRAGRLVAEFAKKRAGVSILVLNVSGAGGSSGVRHVADAKPDGYTVGILGASLVASQYINANANTIDEVDLIAFFGPDPAALEVRSDTGITSIEEYIAKLKANPGSIKNGNDAPGGTSYVAAALLATALDVKITKVPYKGYAPTVAALISGEVQSATLPVHQFVDQKKSGDVNILAIMATERHFMVPDVPTFKELGIDLVAGDWRAIFLPNGVPTDRRAILEKIFVETMRDPEFQATAKNVGFVITPMDSAETKKFVKDFDTALYPVLDKAGLVKTRMK